VYSNEILHVKREDETDYYEVMSVFSEIHNGEFSRLTVELIPLKHVTPVADRQLISLCEKQAPKLTFDLQLDHGSRIAKFATSRHVTLPDKFQSSGLGTYVFSKLIEWGQQIAPDYSVAKLLLSSVDAKTEKSKKTRNGFYESFKFHLDFTHDPEEKNGSCSAKNLRSLAVRKLNPKKVTKTVALHETYIDIGARQLELDKTIASLQGDILNLKEQRNTLKKAREFWRNWCIRSVFAVAVIAIFWRYDAWNVLRTWLV